jgi:hypothetical protein
MNYFRDNDIIFLLGAGASADAGIPVSCQMVKDIEALINTKEWEKYRDLYYLIKSGIEYSAGLTGKTTVVNIETLLFVLNELRKKEEHLLYPFIGSWNIRFNEVVKDNFELIENFRNEIIKKLSAWVTLNDYRRASYFKYFKKIRDDLTFPIRIFTLNYDICIEKNNSNSDFEFSYERGFDESTRLWNHKRFMESERDTEPDIYLYKLHGSIDWIRNEETKIVSYSDSIPSEPDLIFGTQNKLQYVDPYLFLFSEFRHYTLNAKLIVCIGYSFADEHINALISQSLKQNKNMKLLSVLLEHDNIKVNELLSVPHNKIILKDLKAKEFFKNHLTLKFLSDLYPKTNNNDEVF